MYSIPDRLFIDPVTRTDRRLIREAMRGFIPDEVRLNRARGRQSGDLVPRLRASAAEVASTLQSLTRGPARDIIDTDRLNAVWNIIVSEDSERAHHLAVTVLMRCIMAGLFVHRFYGYPGPSLDGEMV
jgi:asparagine synthase (glutamine-hydrolysing)